MGVTVRRTWQAAHLAICVVWAGAAVRVFALHSRPSAAKPAWRPTFRACLGMT